MLQGIWTKWLCPTNARGSRVKAIARIADSFGAEMSQTTSWNHSLNTEDNHARAAMALARKLNWHGLWVGGHRPDNAGYMFVHICREYEGAPTDSIGMEGRDWFFIERQPEGE